MEADNLISTERLKIFTWHVHGSYLFYLSQGRYEIYIPVNSKKSEGYQGKGDTFPFGENVHEVDVEHLQEMDFDCILFQSAKNYLVDQYEVLSAQQRKLPKVYLEHDPPRETPTDTKHVIGSREILVVHVTNFNRLMWDNRQALTKVIEHGVTDPGVRYNGELNKGIVVINNLASRGRRLGEDIFQQIRKHVPVDLIGMNSEDLGGLGEIPHPELPAFLSRYRFLLNPIRYTSLGLSVCEAMMLGMPVVGLATTEMVTVVENGVSGFVHTDVRYLIDKMNELIHDRLWAGRLGENARKEAQSRFGIRRFCREWEHVFNLAVKQTATVSPGYI